MFGLTRQQQLRIDRMVIMGIKKRKSLEIDKSSDSDTQTLIKCTNNISGILRKSDLKTLSKMLLYPNNSLRKYAWQEMKCRMYERR